MDSSLPGFCIPLQFLQDSSLFPAPHNINPIPTRPLLQNLVVNGDVNSRQLIEKTPSIEATVSNIGGHYSLANGDATVHDFRASLLGGEVTLQGTMKNVGTDKVLSSVSAALHSISLADAKRTLGAAASTGSVAIAGTLNGTVTASWGNTFNDLIAKADAAINANVTNAQQARASGHSLNACATSRCKAPDNVPVRRRAVHATYMAQTQQLAVERSYFRTLQTDLNLNGTVSKNSSLAIQLQANDLRELETIADLFRNPDTGPTRTAASRLLAGTASFNGMVPRIDLRPPPDRPARQLRTCNSTDPRGSSFAPEGRCQSLAGHRAECGTRPRRAGSHHPQRKRSTAPVGVFQVQPHPAQTQRLAARHQRNWPASPDSRLP